MTTTTNASVTAIVAATVQISAILGMRADGLNRNAGGL
jgi:hypothetical protein